MTHEEVFTAIARDELRSYRQLPQIWFQIQTKLRDEARPKSGVLRGREFTMKDSYSFDVDFAGLDTAFDRHAEAYRRIFERCGLRAIAVQASSGAMGGSESVEFMSVSEAGEDWTAFCSRCDYAANLEKARSVASKGRRSDGVRCRREVPDAGRTHHRGARAVRRSGEAGAANQDAGLPHRGRPDALSPPRQSSSSTKPKIAEAAGTRPFVRRHRRNAARLSALCPGVSAPSA